MKIMCKGYYESGWFHEGGREINQEDMDEIARFMNDEIRERLHLQLAPCSPETFIRAYLAEDPDFQDTLEEVFDWDDCDGQSKEDFVQGLYDASRYPESATVYDEKTAADELMNLRREWDDVPAISPAEFADAWNALVTAGNEEVILPDGKRVPRWCQMTDKEIAGVIKQACCWDEVKDLVEHVIDAYGLPVSVDDAGGYVGDWDNVVLDWCNQQ